MADQVTTIILGGGKGSRLYPLTDTRSKPAVPIAGKFRLVDIPISNSINAGLKSIFVLTQFNSVSLHRHIHRTYPYEAFNQTSVELLAAEQTHSTLDWFQGSADAVRKHYSNYPVSTTRDFLILSGDHLYRMDYQKIIDFHREKKADITVATIPVLKRDVSDFGILSVKPSGRINSFLEKPGPGEKISDFVIPDNIRKIFGVKSKRELYMASMGIYIFKKEALREALEGNAADFGKEVIPQALKKSRVYGYVFGGYWRDIGTIRSFYDANIELTKANPPFDFSPQKGRIYTRARFLPPSKINDANLTNCLMAETCQIEGAKIQDSVIGLRSIIRKGTTIRKSVLMGNDFFEFRKPLGKPALGIGKDCQIKDAILDKNVRIGNHVKILNAGKVQERDGDNFFIREGIVIIPKGAIIKDGTVI